jgi:hypothetical protein
MILNLVAIVSTYIFSCHSSGMLLGSASLFQLLTATSRFARLDWRTKVSG